MNRAPGTRGGRWRARSLLFAAALMTAAASHAGEVSIEDATFERGADQRWQAAVTLRHADEGWEHYADAWRVVGADGTVFGTRTLFHPHVDEQPFTRSLSGIAIPPGVREIWVEAHDNVHGWSRDRRRVELPGDN